MPFTLGATPVTGRGALSAAIAASAVLLLLLLAAALATAGVGVLWTDVEPY